MAANVIRPKPVPASQIDLGWMRDRPLSVVEFSAPYSWTFLIGEGRLTTEGLWRASLSGRLLVTSEDHGQWYGLSKPVDSAERAAPLVGKQVVDVRVGLEADLTIRFEGEAELQLIATSIGYEAWQVAGPTGICFVASGSGTFSTWRNDA
jgi:Family of unknown function (DUF6188)